MPPTSKMAEVNFARSFLAMLDTRPIKLSGDHVEDPKSYPARSAVRSVPFYSHSTPSFYFVSFVLSFFFFI